MEWKQFSLFSSPALRMKSKTMPRMRRCCKVIYLSFHQAISLLLNVWMPEYVVFWNSFLLQFVSISCEFSFRWKEYFPSPTHFPSIMPYGAHCLSCVDFLLYRYTKRIRDERIVMSWNPSVFWNSWDIMGKRMYNDHYHLNSLKLCSFCCVSWFGDVRGAAARIGNSEN